MAFRLKRASRLRTMTFKEWLFLKEQGTKRSGSGFRSGGMAQHGRHYRVSIRPASPYMPNIKTKINKLHHSI